MITEKDYIQTLKIKRQNEQQLFQIKLPSNAKIITGISVSIRPYGNQKTVIENRRSKIFGLDTSSKAATKNPPFTIKAGNIKLQLNNKKNIFYTEDLCAYQVSNSSEKLMGMQALGYEDSSFGVGAINTIPKAVKINREDTIIKGYYKDTMKVKQLFPYQVNIYITYEFEE
jgi:hypothetical protein